MSATPPPIPPTPLDYGRPGAAAPLHPARLGRPVFSVPGFLFAAVVLLLPIAFALLVIPRLETAYKDFGVKLPALTMVVLGVSRFLSTWLGLMTGVGVALGLAAGIAVLPIRGRWLRVLLVFVFALLVLALALAVLLPILTLMDAISTSPGR